MKNKGFTLIESLIFFSIVLLIIQYLSLMVHGLNQTQNNYDKYYEEAYK